jgi:ABC-type uncharacterized transport system substrate-binding protein
MLTGKKIVFRILLLLAAAFIASPGSLLAADQPREITILLSGHADVHLQMLRSLQRHLGDITDPATRVNSITIGTRDLGQHELAGSDLVIAVGTTATKQLIQANVTVPAISVLVPKLTFDAMAGNRRPPSLSAIYLDQPPARHLALCRGIVPGLNKVGIIWGSTSIDESSDYLAAANRIGVSLATGQLQEDDNLVTLISRILADSDIFLARYDSSALNPTTAKWLLYMAYKNKTPVVGFSQAYVDAGAIAAVYSTPEQIARQTVESAKVFLEGDGEIVHTAAYPEYFSIALNRSVARTIKVNLPDEDVLILQLKQAGTQESEK